MPTGALAIARSEGGTTRSATEDRGLERVPRSSFRISRPKAGAAIQSPRLRRDALTMAGRGSVANYPVVQGRRTRSARGPAGTTSTEASEWRVGMTDAPDGRPAARELRVAITVPDFDRAVGFF